MANVNTGDQEKEQRDVNPTSPTYGQLRWLFNRTNLAACPLPSRTYSSAAISQIVYRDDCGTGTSSGVPYTVPAGQVVSLINQSDADAQAAAYFNSTSQPFARLNAVCSAPAQPIGNRFCQIDANGCFTGYMVDGSGTSQLATLQECSDCNNAQPAQCPIANC